MNPTFHLFCRISPASPPACRPPAARFRRRLCCPLPPSISARPLLRPSRLYPRLRRLFPARPLRVLLCVSARRLFLGRPLRVPALRSGPARFPAACSALYPARPRSACRASGLLLPVPQGQLLQYRHHTVRQGRHRPLVVVAGQFRVRAPVGKRHCQQFGAQQCQVDERNDRRRAHPVAPHRDPLLRNRQTPRFPAFLPGVPEHVFLGLRDA